MPGPRIRSASPSPIRGDERPPSVRVEQYLTLNDSEHVYITPPSPSGLTDTAASSCRPSFDGSVETTSSTRPLIPRPTNPPERQDTTVSTGAKSSNSSSSRRATDDSAHVFDSRAALNVDAAKAWSDCARAMMEYDEATIRGWKEEIDTLLVFAGLFSAVVTAFLVESCKSLHPEPSDRVIALLEVMASQMSNTTAGEASEVDTRFVPAEQAPLVNALWFTSLIFSLGVAFIGLLVKQWFGEYTAGLMMVSRSRVSRKHARARQYRHNAMCKWHVRTIMISLPVILQFALIFFLAGLCKLLWAFDVEVAQVALAFVAAIVVFSIITSVLPTIFNDCSYRSPHALLPYFAWKLLVWFFRAVLRGVLWCTQSPPQDAQLRGISQPATPSAVEEKKNPSLPKPTVSGIIASIKKTGEKRTHWSWKDREEYALSMSCQESYDASMIDELDCLKMDLVVLRDLVQPCLQTLSLDRAFRCVRSILARRADAHDGDIPEWNRPLLDRETLLILVEIVLDLLRREELMAPPVLIQQVVGASGGKRKAVQEQMQALEMQSKALAMLEKLAFKNTHFPLLAEKYSSMVTILMSYRRHLVPESVCSRMLVYTMLSGLAVKLSSDAVDSLEAKDIHEILEYARSTVKTDFPQDNRSPIDVATLAVAVMRVVVDRGPPATGLLLPSELRSLLDQAAEISQVKLSLLVLSYNTGVFHPATKDILDLRVTIFDFLTAVESLLRVQSNIPIDLEHGLWLDLKYDVEAICSWDPPYFASSAAGSGEGERTASEIFENFGKLLRGEVTVASSVLRPPSTRNTTDSLPKPLLRSATSITHQSPPASPTDGPAMTLVNRLPGMLRVTRFIHRQGSKLPY